MFERVAESFKAQMLEELGSSLSDLVGKVDELGGRTAEGHTLSHGVLKRAPLIRALAPALEQAVYVAAAANSAGEFVEVAGTLLPASHPAAIAVRAQADAAVRAKGGREQPVVKGGGS